MIRWIAIALAAVALLAGGGALAWQQREWSRQVVYIIPAGYAARAASGQAEPVLPATIELTREVRDTLVIENRDAQPIQVGPYLIGPGQRFTQRYHSRGTFELLCSVHASQRMLVVVR